MSVDIFQLRRTTTEPSFCDRRGHFKPTQRMPDRVRPLQINLLKFAPLSWALIDSLRPILVYIFERVLVSVRLRLPNWK